MSAGLMAMRSRAAHLVVTDPYFANVATLHHFDVDPASNAATSYDVQGALWEFHQNTGGYGIVPAAAKFGTKGFLIPTSSQSSGFYGKLDASTTITPSWDLNSNDFTVELFIRPDRSFSSGINYGIVVNDNIGVSRGWLMYIDNTAGYLAFAVWVGGTPYAVVDTTSLTTSAWVHVAAVRDSNTLRLYRNGVQVTSTSVSGSVGNPAVLCIGNLVIAGAPAPLSWAGAIDELRVTPGVCRYPGGTTFTPPTAAFPNS